MDAVGSKRGLRRLAPGLRKAGVDVVAMMPAGLFRRSAARFDLRNHRKIAIIDGIIGYTGSQNIVNPAFVKGFPNEESMARVTGPVVAQLQAVFLADHFFETSQPLAYQAHFPQLLATGSSSAQLLPSGPGYGRENGQEFIAALLMPRGTASSSPRLTSCLTSPFSRPSPRPLTAAWRCTWWSPGTPTNS